ncbi:hypothetical protein lbkm_3457 [Lachnospiraceae bacterium KM106-2]|nr:hypothetical protein lbkm_3457 [Lachnospiraceae bacterium KM106-2]
METIQTYVNNMFSNLPQTDKVMQLKSEILQNMEDNYNELKADGKSEHEAISTVISQFGNIDELLDELGIKQEHSDPTYTIEDIKEYQSVEKKKGKIIGLGVVLCILSAGIYNLLDDLILNGYLPALIKADGESIIPMIPFFLLIAVAVGLFIYSGTMNTKFKNITKDLNLDFSTINYIKAEQERIKSSYYRQIIIGVTLCILSPVLYMLFSIPFGDDSGITILLFLLTVATAVYLFIASGMTYGSYSSLIEHNNLKPLEKQRQGAFAVSSSVIFLIATAVYLILGFCYKQWAFNWIVFAIAGLLCGISSTIIHYHYENKRINQ